MYAIARLHGYVEELGFKAWISRDFAKALSIRIGDNLRVESKAGSSSARVVDIKDEIKAGIILSIDAYLAVRGFNTVLIKKLARVYEAEEVAMSFEANPPIGLDDLSQLLNLLIAYRVPIYTNFTGFLQKEDGNWVRLNINGVSPREPAYMSKDTKIHLGRPPKVKFQE